MPTLRGWRFCPRCRAELEVGSGRAACPACGFRAYASSAPTANALVEDAEGRVLLGRRAIEPERGKWDVLGGFLEEGEHPLDAVRRELREETGLDVVPERFLCATVDDYGDGPDAESTLNLVWVARALPGEPRPADDVGELRWFAVDELPPPEELAFRQTASVLAAWRAGRTERSES